MLVHTVFFYLKSDLSGELREDFRRQVATLGEISTVSSFYLGTPAPVPPRPIIDRTYDFGITCVFKDVAAHDAYQVDPIHKVFIDDCKDRWARVQIYDTQG
jgi:hypothetical protein